jgi:hypothetical protein
MVFTDFSRKISIASMGVALSFSALSYSQDEQSWPVYAAQLSDEVISECESKSCTLNVLDAATLSNILNKHPMSMDVHEALNLSEYELLVSSALIETDTQRGEKALVLEMTTSWRGIPVDDFNLKVPHSDTLDATATAVLNQWVSSVQENEVFSAERIYKIIGASDYQNQMQLPETIGDFVRSQTALYHDPLQGSITRYLHPDFADAVVDVSVYPVSPFTHPDKNLEESLSAEMQIERTQIQTLIEQAQMSDYLISEIQTTELTSASGPISGLAMEVALETQIDPVYSTQFLFTQNDKFVKLTGNLPKGMMLSLVNESVAQIKVPQESSFMQSMRQ